MSNQSKSLLTPLEKVLQETIETDINESPNVVNKRKS